MTIRSSQQLNASIEAVDRLKKSINCPVNSQIPKELVDFQIAKIESKISNLEAKINEYQRLQNTKVSELSINSFEELLTIPIKYRIAKKITIDAFSKQVGVSKRQIIRYEESDYQNCSIPTFKKILDSIGVRIEGYIL